MEKRTKNRLVMLGILAAAGLLAIGAGSALGAEGIFNSNQKDVKAVVNGSQVRIYEDDREIHNFTLPEGQNHTNYTWEISNDGNKIELHETEELEDSHQSGLNETEHESGPETHGETNGNESLNETGEAGLEDSHDQGVNETRDNESGETHGDGANGTQENRTDEPHGSVGNSTQESGLNGENETSSEHSLELSLQSSETQGSKAED